MVEQARGELGVRKACEVLGVSRATYYRRQRPRATSPRPRPSPTIPRKLTLEEKGRVLELFHREDYVNASPYTVWAQELDEDHYHCSVSTMYRILREHDEVRERRNQRRHPKYARPELLATKPNQLWSWDITKLRGPSKLLYYSLYVILDIFSRYVVGWTIAERESKILARLLIEETCRKQGIEAGELTLHADRGSSMKSQTVAQLLVNLGVIRSHSRPHVSNDNPYSESAFKTFKYHPDFPDRFGSAQDARAHFRPFFTWYNQEHRHTALGLMTPAAVHYGEVEAIREKRQRRLEQAYLEHPERFVRGVPIPPPLPEAVWINKPDGDGPWIETPQAKETHSPTKTG